MQETLTSQILIPLSEVENMMRKVFTEVLYAKQSEDQKDKLLSPEETCKLFQPAISKPTLDSYSKKQLLTKYRMGGRTWFKKGEVLEAMKTIKKYQR